MTGLGKNQLISKRDKERNKYFFSKFFLAGIPFMVQYFYQFTHNRFLDWCYERLVSHFFTMFPFYIPRNYRSNLWFLMISGSIKVEHYEEKSQTF